MKMICKVILRRVYNTLRQRERDSFTRHRQDHAMQKKKKSSVHTLYARILYPCAMYISRKALSFSREQLSSFNYPNARSARERDRLRSGQILLLPLGISLTRKTRANFADVDGF